MKIQGENISIQSKQSEVANPLLKVASRGRVRKLVDWIVGLWRKKPPEVPFPITVRAMLRGKLRDCQIDSMSGPNAIARTTNGTPVVIQVISEALIAPDDREKYRQFVADWVRYQDYVRGQRGAGKQGRA